MIEGPACVRLLLRAGEDGGSGALSLSMRVSLSKIRNVK